MLYLNRMRANDFVGSLNNLNRAFEFGMSYDELKVCTPEDVNRGPRLSEIFTPSRFLVSK